MKRWAALLLGVGLAQMTGDLLSVPALKGVAAAWMLSPAPKVFSAVGGYETYSTRFYLDLSEKGGVRRSVQVTPELYAQVRGPYNRRNVYGAALSYGPVMPERLRTPVMRYALCNDAPLLRELGIDASLLEGNVQVRFEPRPGTDLKALGLPERLEAQCL